MDKINEMNKAENVKTREPENHSHICVDEVYHQIKGQLDEIYWYWKTFDLRCDDVKGDSLTEHCETCFGQATLMHIQAELEVVHSYIKVLAQQELEKYPKFNGVPLDQVLKTMQMAQIERDLERSETSKIMNKGSPIPSEVRGVKCTCGGTYQDVNNNFIKCDRCGAEYDSG